MGAKVVAFIPARYGSTRFPGKPLVPILNKTMIEWVYIRTKRCTLLDRVIVATDDHRIYDAVKKFGGEAMMTSTQHPTGTDRLAEASEAIDCDIVLNIQVDEPLVRPSMIEALAMPLLQKNGDISMSTLATYLQPGYLEDPHRIKVVTGLDGCALYFSRAPIPFPWEKGGAQSLHHLGFYGYRKDFLLQFPQLPRTPLEKRESLEQLRALEHGYRIRVVYTREKTVGVDRPGDLALVSDALFEEEQL